MIKYEKNLVFYILSGIVALICGMIVYLVFRPETYVSKFVFEIIELQPITPSGSVLFSYYIADFLWAFSLSCFMYAIYLPEGKNAMICSGVVAAVGFTYELMQYFGVVSGTGDVADVLLYLLAAIAVNIINYLRRRKNEKKETY